MRYAKEHKPETRQRIIQAAGQRFKQDGINSAGVATVMADAGLTNGAFYGHFSSKEDLVASTIADQLHAQQQDFNSLPPGHEGVVQIVRNYLSAVHRDNPAHGCPSAAMLDEIGRCTDTTKQVYTDGLMAVMDAMATRLSLSESPAARSETLTVFAMMVGTIQLSRALSDRELADRLLERATEEVLRLLDAAARPAPDRG